MIVSFAGYIVDLYIVASLVTSCYKMFPCVVILHQIDVTGLQQRVPQFVGGRSDIHLCHGGWHPKVPTVQLSDGGNWSCCIATLEDLLFLWIGVGLAS